MPPLSLAYLLGPSRALTPRPLRLPACGSHRAQPCTEGLGLWQPGPPHTVKNCHPVTATPTAANCTPAATRSHPLRGLWVPRQPGPPHHQEVCRAGKGVGRGGGCCALPSWPRGIWMDALSAGVGSWGLFLWIWFRGGVQIAAPHVATLGRVRMDAPEAVAGATSDACQSSSVSWAWCVHTTHEPVRLSPSGRRSK